jgi:hypothetical protein
LWRWLSSGLDVRRLVFLRMSQGERSIAMDRLRSRASRGDRTYGKVPKNRGKNLTLIASMSLEGMGESMCLQRGPPTRKPSRPTTWSTSWPLPLARGAGGGDGQPWSSQTRGRIRELIEERGAQLVFVPSYSPDLNPIEEQAFSKIKTILRKL